MRLESIRLRGFWPFVDELSLDLSKTEGLIAVCGANGAGKSTFLELWGPGAFYRKTPTRGTLGARATSSDALLEARVVNGKAWTITHTVDPSNGKGESFVLDANNEPAFDSAKKRAFDRWSLDHLPPPELLFAGMFQAQGSAGFLGMGRTERMNVILRAIGCERYERLAKLAREREAAELAKLHVTNERLTDEAARAKPVANAQAELLERTAGVAKCEDGMNLARKWLVSARAEAETAREARRAYDGAIQARAALAARIESLLTQEGELFERVANNRAVLTDADQIRAAFARVAKIETEMTDLARAEQLDEQARQAAGREAEAHQRSAAAADGRAAEARARADRMRKRLAEMPSAAAAAEALPKAIAEADDYARGVEVFETGLEAFRSQRVAGAEDRIEALRVGLDTISSKVWLLEECQTHADLTLRTDDDSVDRARTLPEAIRNTEAQIRSARDRAAVAERRRSDLERLASTLPEFDRIDADIAEAERSASAAEQEASTESLAAKAALSRARELARRIQEHGEAFRAAREATAEATPLARRAQPLANAEARLLELEPQLEALRKQRAELEEQLSATPEPGILPPPAPELAAFEEALARAEHGARAAHGEFVLAERALQEALDASARISALELDRAGIETELADWSRLAADLGRDGIQAAEVDSVGTELTEVVNDLLRECHGNRFTVRIDTQRTGAKGQVIEECGVTVIDSVAGREAEGSTFSGGEKVIIGEALSLALSMLACRRMGAEGATLVRDESAAALSPENVRAYVAMLRRAQKQVGARNILFVCHSLEAQELADARITIADGRVTLS